MPDLEHALTVHEREDERLGGATLLFHVLILGGLLAYVKIRDLLARHRETSPVPDDVTLN